MFFHVLAGSGFLVQACLGGSEFSCSCCFGLIWVGSKFFVLHVFGLVLIVLFLPVSVGSDFSGSAWFGPVVIT